MEPESDITVVLELSDQKYKITIINMPRQLQEKVDNMQHKQRDGNSKK